MSEMTELKQMFEKQGEMFEKHAKSSLDFRETVITSLAKIEVHGEYTKKQLDANTKDIEVVKKDNDKTQGGFRVAAVLLAATVSKIVFDIFKP